MKSTGNTRRQNFIVIPPVFNNSINSAWCSCNSLCLPAQKFSNGLLLLQLQSWRHKATAGQSGLPRLTFPMPQCPWPSGCPGVPHMHEEIQLSSGRDLWDLRQVPCLGPLCPSCRKVHESVETELCRDIRGPVVSRFLHGWSRVSKTETAQCGRRGQGTEGGGVLALEQQGQC